MSSSHPSIPHVAAGAVRPAPEDEAEVLGAVADAERGELVTMTAADFEKWMVTGEAPWPGSSGSAPAT
jgi:hypothetical protein